MRREPTKLRQTRIAAVLIAWLACDVIHIDSGAAEIDFARDVHPILSENCFLCHGPDDGSRATELRLDTAAGIRASIDGAPVAAAGNAAGSLLYQRITADDPAERMPPPEANKTLTPAQVEVIRKWLESGAEYREHWSLRPIQSAEPPPVSRADATAHPIDAFVLSRLEREGLAPSPEAEPYRLLRRVSLDLTGLPPTEAELADFLEDPSPAAYARAVDRLLSSPAYGERMAWDWLDAARYADSNGYQGDNERSMWPWRDWVVQSFHRNQPFNTFTVEQLAGDLLPEATFEQRLATGFCRNHMINGEGGRIAEENRVDYVMDMTETMGTVWLGLTLNCCRCHDHKFDPLTRREYYGLFAYFNQTPVKGNGRDPQTPPVLAVYSAAQRTQLAKIDAKLADVTRELRARVAVLASEQQAWESRMIAEQELQRWRPLAPAEVRAEHAALTVLPDGTVLAEGESADRDAYVLTTTASAGTLRALRVEALQHESFKDGGLSRAVGGNFVLTDLRLEVHAPHPAGSGDPLVTTPRFVTARATFEQPGHAAAAAIDDDPQTGWAVWEGKPVDRSHAAVFVLAEPMELSEGSELVVRLRHDSSNAGHVLGRVRLSISEDAEAPATVDDAELLLALQVPASSRTKEQADRVQQTQQSQDAQHVRLTTTRNRLQKERKAIDESAPQVMVMEDQPEYRTTHLLERGLYNQPGEVVTATTPACLPAVPADAPPNRLTLARWLTSDEHPLTARVTVNRLWQQLFGIGLVKTPEDFGAQGEIPEHAALLDWLAADFRDHGWDVQRLLREIVTSHTYRQSSRVTPALVERDPQNRLLARGPRFRMPSWMLRDQALAAGGLLVRTVGGPPVNGYQPEGVWEEATFGTKKYVQEHGDALYRRSLYTFWRRIIGPTMYFDSAARQVCTVKVLRTNTPLHALSTLNDVTYVEAARALAQRALQRPGDDDDRLAFVYRCVLCRAADEEETRIWKPALARSREEFAAEPNAAERLLRVGESPRDPALPAVEHAAWTSLCLAVLNLDEAVTKE